MTLRLLCNENVPRVTVETLRAQGHDVAWIRTDSPGIPDADVLARARREGRVCVTFDKDFGELAARSPMPAGCGLVLLRVSLQTPGDGAVRAAMLIDARRDWAGCFSVIDERRTRMRTLAPPG